MLPSGPLRTAAYALDCPRIGEERGGWAGSEFEAGVEGCEGVMKLGVEGTLTLGGGCWSRGVGAGEVLGGEGMLLVLVGLENSGCGRWGWRVEADAEEGDEGMMMLGKET